MSDGPLKRQHAESGGFPTSPVSPLVSRDAACLKHAKEGYVRVCFFFFLAFGFLAFRLLGFLASWLFGFLLVYAAFGGFGFPHPLLSQLLSGLFGFCTPSLVFGVGFQHPQHHQFLSDKCSLYSCLCMYVCMYALLRSS